MHASKALSNDVASMLVRDTRAPRMRPCPELKRLPKAKRLKSINYRRQTPGSPVNLLGPTPKANILDPTHPVSRASTRTLPVFRSTEFGIRAYPMAMLMKSEPMWQIQSVPFDTWKNRLARGKEMLLAREWEEHEHDAGSTMSPLAPMLLNNPLHNRIPMSYLTVNNKTRTTAKRQIRSTITRKLKHSINLIVQRGADTKEVKGRDTLVFGQNDGTGEAPDQDQWILQGWTYLFFPTLHIYKMPYQQLIPRLRTALRFIFHAGTSIEQRWIEQIPFSDLKNSFVHQHQHQHQHQKLRPPPPSAADEELEPPELELPEDHTSPEDQIPTKLLQRTPWVSGITWRSVGDTDDIDADTDTSEYTPDEELFKTPTNPARPLMDLGPRSHSHPRPRANATTLPLPQRDNWRFTDAPAGMTEAEDAWADKYPSSVREMAQRKLFRRSGPLTRLRPGLPRKEGE